MANFNVKDCDSLFSAVLKLDSIEECREFFTDICTIKEIQDMAQRFEVARLLSAGKNYQEVVKQTGASTATISRVNKCLLYGDGGYKNIIDKLNGEDKND